MVGGLGLRDLELLKKIVEAKLWWRWMQGGPQLWRKIWNMKYKWYNSQILGGVMATHFMPKQEGNVYITNGIHYFLGHSISIDFWKETNPQAQWKEWTMKNNYPVD